LDVGIARRGGGEHDPAPGWGSSESETRTTQHRVLVLCR
jgi:hypothetical protein